MGTGGIVALSILLVVLIVAFFFVLRKARS
jgi:hypothetical protein